MKNWLIRTLLPLMQSTGCADTDRILIVSTTGLGDTLWATPIVRALKEQKRASYIALLTSPIGKEVFRENPHVDAIFLLKQWHKLRKEKIGTILLFHASQRLSLPIALLTCAKRVICTDRGAKGLEDLCTDLIPEETIHEVARRAALVSPLGVTVTDFRLELHINEKERRCATDFLKKDYIDPKRPLIAVHPGAQDRFKQWPEESFIKLVQRLQADHNAQILITGTQNEKPLLDRIQKETAGSHTVILPFREFAALLGKVSLFISNDTGPMHAALAMGTPLIALFGPTNPDLCGPYKTELSHVRLIKRTATCTPCLKKRCLEPFCLLQISSDEVYDHALQLLRKS